MNDSKYNYEVAVYDDVASWVEENIDRLIDRFYDCEDTDELEEYLNDTLWCEDCVTGNGSGNYTFNRYEAESLLCHNFDLIEEAFSEFGGKPDFSNPETIDVTIRCYLLASSISHYLSSDDFNTLWEEKTEEKLKAYD